MVTFQMREAINPIQYLILYTIRIMHKYFCTFPLANYTKAFEIPTHKEHCTVNRAIKLNNMRIYFSFHREKERIVIFYGTHQKPCKSDYWKSIITFFYMSRKKSIISLKNQIFSNINRSYIYFLMYYMKIIIGHNNFPFSHIIIKIAHR